MPNKKELQFYIVNAKFIVKAVNAGQAQRNVAYMFADEPSEHSGYLMECSISPSLYGVMDELLKKRVPDAVTQDDQTTEDTDEQPS